MLKTEDLKTAYLKSEDSKYAFMCWVPHLSMKSQVISLIIHQPTAS